MRDYTMTWTAPQVSETETGMEVTSYMPAELDRA
ncbi:MAG: pyrroloquinoline quinone precursor peptide PqqA [Hyphomicrobiales bacterium]